MEIERKFLVDKSFFKDFKRENHFDHDIMQYYIKIGNEEERFRKSDEKFFHTLKVKVDKGLEREEIETECAKEDFYANIISKIGNVIHKHRYDLFVDNLKFEIDEYQDELAGLVTCEVEFQSKIQAKNFSAPKFCVEEVTFDKNYKNQSLATRDTEKTTKKDFNI